jgi:predicted anti-sigma-YlaC factor YlaD
VSDGENHPLPVLRRVLGPAGPELTCEQCFELLDEYVELELARAGADQAVSGMQAHLAGCSACREEHDSLLALLADDERAR